MPWDVVAIRLSLALFLGIVVGLERQLRQNTTGLRMNSLVSVGAASFVLFGHSIAVNGLGTPDSLARISSQIITGIGFLGGGVIMREGTSIKGIATAATLWCSAAIGMFAGAGFIASAIVCTGFIVATNLALRPIAWCIKKRIEMPHITSSGQKHHSYTLDVTCKSTAQDHIRALLLREIHDSEFHLKALESKNTALADAVEINMHVTATNSKDTVLEHIVSHLSLQPSIIAAKWMDATS